MPELAEVEVVRRTLRTMVVGQKITDIIIRYNSIIDGDVEAFKFSLVNKKISDILRLGKVLIFVVEDYYFTSHLKMEGKYFIKDKSEVFDKHEHIIFRLEDFDLRYADVRKFGKMSLKKDDLYNTPPLSNIGLEVFDDKLNKEYLLEKCNKDKPIKSLLLDQQIMAGLGNIYVDEVLFKSRIHPNTLGSKLNLIDFDNIIKHSKEILTKSISEGGTTIRSYTSSLNVTGNYQNYLLVHTREGDGCFDCGSLILKTRVNGRGTYFCPNCQKEIV